MPWDAFDYLTPSELSAISKDYNQNWLAEQKLSDARAARIIVAVYQAAGAKDVKESDYMPKYVNESKTKSAPKNQTNEEMIRNIKMMFGIMNS